MKKLFFTLLVGALFFSCQKSNDEIAGPQSGDTKKVAISIKKEAISRSTLGSSVTSGSETALTDGTLYFFNSGETTVFAYEITDADFDSIAAGKGFIIDSIPSTSYSVAMVANTEGDYEVPASLDDFKKLELTIDGQASMAGATGLVPEGEPGEGEPNAIQGIALIDNLGEGNILEPATEQNDNYTHTASITLVPAVARIEITADAIKLKEDNETNLLSFDFNGIYINDYASKYTLALAPPDDDERVGLTVTTGGNTDWVTAYNDLTPSEYLHNELDPGDEKTVGGESDGTAGGYAFHVFPGATPDIIFRGINLNYEGVVDGENIVEEGPLFWMVDKYWNNNADQVGEDGYVEGKGTPITEFQPGNVYRISSVILGSTHAKQDPYDENVSVEITLEVLPWQEVTTYVEAN